MFDMYQMRLLQCTHRLEKMYARNYLALFRLGPFPEKLHACF